MTVETSTAVIRQWARDQGMTVGDRGRLNPNVLSAYYEQQGHQPAKVAVPSPRSKPPAKSFNRLSVAARPVAGATGTAMRVRVKKPS